MIVYHQFHRQRTNVDKKTQT